MDNLIIIEGNKLIAEFMKYEKNGVFYSINIFNLETFNQRKHHEEQLCFHTSWDWLKPVINEIAKYSLAYPEQTSGVRNMSIIVEIIPAWKSVIEFIKWYNLNNNNVQNIQR